MGKKSLNSVNAYISSLTASLKYGPAVVYHEQIDEKNARWAEPEKPLHPAIKGILDTIHIKQLFGHQAKAMDYIRSGLHTVVATPTASGKTLVYNLPVLEKILENPKARALYIFPLKALAQDQLKTFEKLTAVNSDGITATAKIYDGDTSQYQRQKIRKSPPNVLMTNPEMIHLSLLPYHDKWADVFRDLKIIVVDEVHTYTGIMGSHMAFVFRRLRRICRHYGSDPVFVFASATVKNPAVLAGQLSGITVREIIESTAPAGKKNILFIDPVDHPAQTAIQLLKSALVRGLRTIVYTQSRKLAELIAIWAKSRAGAFKEQISAYRAGFLPEERREIEKKLETGELLAVITTSALELGIDIGDLDLCILVGYPGTIVSTWQRGGRVGRGGQESALMLIAGEDALDRYFLRNPKELIHREPEAAVVNPYNIDIMSKHLVCAAAEMTLEKGEEIMQKKRVQEAVWHLAEKGELFISDDGETIFSRLKMPHRHVDLRGAGSRYQIISTKTDRSMGQIDGFRVFRETHPGAVYLHKGETYLVESLDTRAFCVKVKPMKINYHTRVRADKDTRILKKLKEKTIFGFTLCYGSVRITDHVKGYDRIQTRGGTLMGRFPLDLPPLTYETTGLWFPISKHIQKQTGKELIHFMGGIHAVEHALIGIFPLTVMADRKDIGGISTPFHEQVEDAAIFIYDGIPGGAGLCEQAFENAEDLFNTAYDAVFTCNCDNGCPSCVHSPKCGSGNRPIDKSAALFILNEMIRSKPGVKVNCEKDEAVNRKMPLVKAACPKKDEIIHFGVMDIETQRSAREVGGWHRADLMKVSCAVLYDSKTDEYYEYVEGQVPMFIEKLKSMDLVVGFNIKRFDYAVLSGYTSFDFTTLPTMDILEKVKDRLGYRLSLDHLAKETLGSKKTADGLMALKWWKEGKMRNIIEYCKSDVKITKDLYLFGKKEKYLLFRNKAKARVRLPIEWDLC